MFIRYDIQDTLDLTQFRLQYIAYIKSQYQLNYNFNFPHYKIEIQSFNSGNQDLNNPTYSFIVANILLFDLKYSNSYKCIVDMSPIDLKQDIRFNHFSIITKNLLNEYTISFSSSDPDNIINNICEVIKLTFKFNKLNIFN